MSSDLYMNKKTIIISSIVCFIGIIATLTFWSIQENDIEGKKIDTTFNEIEKDIESLKEIENSIYELSEQQQIESNYLDIDKENPLEKYHSQENTINYMIATAILEEVDFFMESFLVEPFSKDNKYLDCLKNLNVNYLSDTLN